MALARLWDDSNFELGESDGLGFRTMSRSTKLLNPTKDVQVSLDSSTNAQAQAAPSQTQQHQCHSVGVQGMLCHHVLESSVPACSLESGA